VNPINSDTDCFPLQVSVHPDDGMGDLRNSGLAWGTLIDPGLALLSPRLVQGVIETSPKQPLRLLAGPPEPAAGSLLDAPVVRTLLIQGPQDRLYLVMQADLTGWDRSGEPPWSPDVGDPFDADTAALADLILSRCTAPDENWFGRAEKARAEQGQPPWPYPFPSWPDPEPPVDTDLTISAEARRPRKPMWYWVLHAAARRHRG
jgi:hypothetical protein